MIFIKLSFILLFFSIFMPKVFSNPILISNSNEYSEQSILYIGNCHIDKPADIIENAQLPLLSIVTPKPKGIEGADIEWLEMVHKQPLLLALSNQGVLYGFDDKTGEEKLQLPLLKEENGKENAENKNFFLNQGHLSISKVFYNDAAHLLLAVVIPEFNQGFVFEVFWNPSEQQFHINTLTAFTPKGLHKILAKPIFARLENDLWGILWGGETREGQGGIEFIPFQAPEKILDICFPEAKGIHLMEAMDLNTRGVVDLIYAGDLTGGLWADKLRTDTKETNEKFKPRKITDLQILAGPWVIKDKQGIGTKLYALSKPGMSEPRIFRFNDNLNLDIKPKVLDQEPALTFKIRFGRALIIPKSMKAPTVINVADEKTVPILWEKMGSKSREEMAESQNVAAALLWDLKERKDVIITLNSKCQLSCWAAKVNQDKLGRISFIEEKDLR